MASDRSVKSTHKLSLGISSSFSGYIVLCLVWVPNPFEIVLIVWSVQTKCFVCPQIFASDALYLTTFAQMVIRLPVALLLTKLLTNFFFVIYSYSGQVIRKKLYVQVIDCSWSLPWHLHKAKGKFSNQRNA